jgi:PAS domain S-box-containing protein
MRSRPLVRGIRDKLVLATSALIALIALFVMFFFPGQVRQQALRSTADRAAAVAEMASFSLAAGMMFHDTTAVNDVLDEASNARDVAFLAAWDDRGGLVASRGTGVPATPPVGGAGAVVTDDGALVTTVAIGGTGAPVGTLALGISLEPVHAEVRRARTLGAVVSVLILAFGLAAVLLISRFVTRPLTAVAETVNRIAAGDMRSRAAETSDVETLTLVRAFNRMIDTLASTQAELAASNHELEDRVARRTAELTRTSQLLQSFIDVAPQAIIAVDTEAKVIRWNFAAEHLFGWSAGEVLGKELPFMPPTEESIGETIARLDRGEEVGTAVSPVEVLRIRRDGQPVSVLLSSARLDLDGTTLGYVGILTDLTERKRLENQLRQSQKMEAVGRLAGGIAHDFNNILTIITTCTELLMATAPEGEAKSLLDHIAGASARAAALTRQLLTFTRQQVVQPRAVDVGAVIGALEPMLRRVLPTNIRLTTTLPRGLGDILADSSQLEQVVMNLVTNAADAMSEGGTLDIDLSHVELDERTAGTLQVKAGSHLRLRVADSGVGIDEALLPRVFDPFFTTKDVGKGTGLGLATVYGIVTALGGEIHVTSRKGKGTTFEMHIPLCGDAEIREALSGPSLKALPPEPAARTVLLVEDEPLVRQIVRRSLVQAGYLVLEAGDGEDALAVMAEFDGPLDAIVTDMMMPGMSGRVLTDLLRTSHPHLGVVYISGYTESELGDEAALDEEHVFLQKPFSNRQLLTAVARVTGAGVTTARG